ncbi:MAG: CRISPR-associated protein Cas4 [Roseiflexus sp.]|nr:CRISPR-associated protein Cas4 [Roseiflexus sp.]MCS7287668.1 CRISPR-associated protein Cas4 [Roseiflexus sp.]MDW8233683.1 CRISPR-associated protein Cas4 [Roseiflexaceae bacterium]
MAITIGLALLLLALLALIGALRLRAAAGLPWAPVVYCDTNAQSPERPIVSRRLGLVGKPDYLIEKRGRLIPMEVKPGRNASRPYESDLMQLAAYCLLIEETTGIAPPYGLLRYADRTFRLSYTTQVREETLALIKEMRAALDNERDRSHDDPARCRGCGFFAVCDQALRES